MKYYLGIDRKNGICTVAVLYKIMKIFNLCLICFSSLFLYGVGLAQTVQTGIPYGPKVNQRFDLYTPATVTASTTTIILIHGGGWYMGDKSSLNQIATGLQNRGYIVANTNYLLDAPGGKNIYPTAVDNVRAAINLLKNNANLYQINTNRIVAFGTSAGAQIALCLGESQDVNAVVDFYSPTDFTDPLLLNKQGGISAKYVAQYLGGTLLTAYDNYLLASPLLNVDSNSVPVTIFHGTNDGIIPLEQVQKYYNALQALGIPSYLHVIPKVGHDFLVISPKPNIYLDQVQADLAQFGY